MAGSRFWWVICRVWSTVAFFHASNRLYLCQFSLISSLYIISFVIPATLLLVLYYSHQGYATTPCLQALIKRLKQTSQTKRGRLYDSITLIPPTAIASHVSQVVCTAIWPQYCPVFSLYYPWTKIKNTTILNY